MAKLQQGTILVARLAPRFYGQLSARCRKLFRIGAVCFRIRNLEFFSVFLISSEIGMYL
jgi:hypothetical protein